MTGVQTCALPILENGNDRQEIEEPLVYDKVDRQVKTQPANGKYGGDPGGHVEYEPERSRQGCQPTVDGRRS